jgi:hypothetical protein
MMWVLCLVERVQNRGELESRGVFSDGEARSFEMLDLKMAL